MRGAGGWSSRRGAGRGSSSSLRQERRGTGKNGANVVRVLSGSFEEDWEAARALPAYAERRQEHGTGARGKGNPNVVEQETQTSASLQASRQDLLLHDGIPKKNAGRGRGDSSPGAATRGGKSMRSSPPSSFKHKGPPVWLTKEVPAESVKGVGGHADYTMLEGRQDQEQEHEPNHPDTPNFVNNDGKINGNLPATTGEGQQEKSPGPSTAQQVDGGPPTPRTPRMSDGPPTPRSVHDTPRSAGGVHDTPRSETRGVHDTPRSVPQTQSSKTTLELQSHHSGSGRLSGGSGSGHRSSSGGSGPPHRGRAETTSMDRTLTPPPAARPTGDLHFVHEEDEPHELGGDHLDEVIDHSDSGVDSPALAGRAATGKALSALIKSNLDLLQLLQEAAGGEAVVWSAGVGAARRASKKVGAEGEEGGRWGGRGGEVEVRPAEMHAVEHAERVRWLARDLVDLRRDKWVKHVRKFPHTPTPYVWARAIIPTRPVPHIFLVQLRKSIFVINLWIFTGVFKYNRGSVQSGTYGQQCPPYVWGWSMCGNYEGVSPICPFPGGFKDLGAVP